MHARPDRSPLPRFSLSATLWRGGAFALIWWILAEGRADSWGIGAVTVALATTASLRLAPPGQGRVSFPGLLGFAAFFLVQSAWGGAQVAARAFRSRMDLAPALVDLPVTLPAGMARILLLNTLNLMPGTVSVELRGNRLCLHVLDHRLPVAEEVRQTEAHIARMLRVAA
ncbi:MAG: multicomponent Na+:H+ antiporter subunit E [bacterium]|nr:MAG: multicomponent Na+:H+ antiporter subunit E [bacterium]KAF0149335.1 MAG: multicomponent Na+:H+ antiporter subunit E [bacterium]KAF0169857.1 MAG: multicomponent Na+:H+ antiporter subunit E [bacterium]TXT18558.1 MAG: multicomponent Na+:H+ antiporter subunit E [bacterium]